MKARVTAGLTWAPEIWPAIKPQNQRQIPIAAGVATVATYV